MIKVPREAQRPCNNGARAVKMSAPLGLLPLARINLPFSDRESCKHPDFGAHCTATEVSERSFSENNFTNSVLMRSLLANCPIPSHPANTSAPRKRAKCLAVIAIAFEARCDLSRACVFQPEIETRQAIFIRRWRIGTCCLSNNVTRVMVTRWNSSKKNAHLDKHASPHENRGSNQRNCWIRITPLMRPLRVPSALHYSVVAAAGTSSTTSLRPAMRACVRYLGLTRSSEVPESTFEPHRIRSYFGGGAPTYHVLCHGRRNGLSKVSQANRHG